MYRFLFLLALPVSVLAQQPDVLTPVYQQQLTGYTAGKFNASYDHRILAQDVDKLVAPFKQRTEDRCWQSEFWGKWFTSAVQAYRYRPTPELKALLDKAVKELIATQTPDGYIGNYAYDKHFQQWDIWGRKYCMLGLLAYYDITNDKKALQAAVKEADFLMKELNDKQVQIVKQGNYQGMAASSVLEPVVQLYTRTRNKKYLDFAERIVQQWEQPGGLQLITKSNTDVAKRFPKPAPNKWFGWDNGQKAYEMMSCYEGLLELYRVTGNDAYKKAVEVTWDNIRRTEINLAGSGSAVECWFGGQAYQTLPMKHYQETCVTATWIKLSQQLLRLTGDAKYADAIEQTFYNALLASMTNDGSDWAKYTPLAGLRMEGSEQCHMGTNCCVASGPRGLFTLPSTAVMTDAQGLHINFYLPGKYDVTLPGGVKAVIAQQTNYPVDGKVVIVVQPSKASAFTVQMRVPEWSAKSSVTVNGEAVNNTKAGSYLAINRTWKTGDSITLELDMRGRVHEQDRRIAITRGPLLLARDARLGGPDSDMPLTAVAKDGYINLTPVTGTTSNIWLRVNAPVVMESYREGGAPGTSLVFCDYASAGNTLDSSSRFRVWLPKLIDPAKL
ncbi:beta-L-arabinofuranosidase domain-containing protein [uncultured Chitinophaga sp.]|uniref:glycoside hydrolase family 127 protein n=1 Tax=uncultured Chitinophaga sp. TaxID=339340 RepID=UPI002600FEC1|nr:beta-L-arabinofuranosidase domain-containing protein [uncultured Chitinophaga sp.]